LFFIVKSRKDDRTQKLREKIKLLTQREETLQQETNELREQNELLEFRIIELEETHDKVSVRQ
jgi:DNA-directed RNA polymerase specialized sigma54-like protein